MAFNSPSVLGGGSNLLNSSGAQDVGGPTSSTDKALVRWNGATGSLVQNGVVTEADYTGTLTGPTEATTTTAAGSAFTNQPSNDIVEVISSNAGDTTRTVTIIGTTTATNTIVVETVTLNGTTAVPTVKTDWGVIVAVSKSAATLGTVTVRKKTGAATITAGMTAAVLSVGVNAVSAANQQAYNRTVSFVASGATTKQIAVQGTDTTGATIYASIPLTGATAVSSGTSFVTITNIYSGDVEGTRTVTVTNSTSWTLTAGALALTATGTNQNITLTPSGTGAVNTSADIVSTAAAVFNLISASSQSLALRSGSGSTNIDLLPGQTQNARLTQGGHTLLGGLTTDGTGVLQFPAATTSAGGITFGTDCFLYRDAAAELVMNVGSNLFFNQFGIQAGIVGSASAVVYGVASGKTNGMYSGGTNILAFSTNSTAALTLDASQNATFANTVNLGANGRLTFNGRGQIGSSATDTITLYNSSQTGLGTLSLGGSGNATTTTILQKAVTAIANNTATDVMTVTIPNAAHSANITITLAGSLGAGGSVGANEATQCITYDLAVTRVAGVNATVTLSTGYASASTNVAGAATVNVTGTLTAVSGAVGATNTFTVQVTVARSAGTSTNHTCQLRAEILNANVSGITAA